MPDGISFVPGFTNDRLTLALLKVPELPGRIGRLNLFRPEPLTTTRARIEVAGQRLALVPELPRGAPPTPDVRDRRGLIEVPIPHFPIRDTLLADSIQDVRAFGTNEPESFPAEIQRRIDHMGRRLDLTLEWLRLGAVRGKVITAVDRITGAPVIVRDLFRFFNVAPQPVLEWPIIGAGAIGQEAAAWAGELTEMVNILGRQMAQAMPTGDTVPFTIHGIAGATFFDAFTAHPERRAAYFAIDNGPLVNPERGRQVTFRDVTIEEYRAGPLPNGVQFIEPDVCHFFPVGTLPDLYVELYAPCDYIDAVNTKALPRYMKRQRLDFGKGEAIEASMNVMPLCTSPRVLFTAKAVEWAPIANGGGGGSAGGNGNGNAEPAALAASRTRRAA